MSSLVRAALLCLLGASSTAWAATTSGLGCHHLRLVLDPRLTPAVLERDWGSGSPHREAPAILELRGCKNQLLDRLKLEGPLARLSLHPIRGAPQPTFLVSVDLTAEAGTYNGPLTLLVQVVHKHLAPAAAQTPDGHTEPIHLAATGKAAWKKKPVRNVDDFLSVSCQPSNSGFVTSYSRYHPERSGWVVKTRSEAGIWESDGAFPEDRMFPSEF